MKKILIVSLVCLNVALLGALFLGVSAPKAHALEGAILQNNYVLIPGQVAANEDAIYIIDLANGRLAALRFDINEKQLVPLGTRTLSRDFSGS